MGPNDLLGEKNRNVGQNSLPFIFVNLFFFNYYVNVVCFDNHVNNYMKLDKSYKKSNTMESKSKGQTPI